ncbi:ankyrin repeat domain-containing protein [Chloropicon primus]|nr:ankyrin repeat domain-containing protein [Chloropicon primus]
MEVTRGGSAQEGTGAKNTLDVLPGSAWFLVLKKLSPYDQLALGLTCKAFLEAVTTATIATRTYPSGRPPKKKKKKKTLPLRTDLTKKRLYEEMPCFSLDWFQWVFQSFERKKGAAGRRENKFFNHLYDADLMHLAAFQGSKKVVEWLASQGIPLDIKRDNHGVVAVGGAAKGGHLDVVQWLQSQHSLCPWKEETCSEAAAGGQLHVLQWLRSQDPPCPWSDKTCAAAASGGQLHVLQWLRSQDPPCPWDDETCSDAAQGGHLEVLKWARSQNPPCEWDEGTCGWAAWRGHLEVLKWARSQDPPCPWDAEECIECAEQNGNDDVADWIEENGLSEVEVIYISSDDEDDCY